MDFRRSGRAPLAALLLIATDVALNAADEPVELTPMKVGAFCPIVKVGEYQMSEGRKGASVVADGEYLYIVGGANKDSERLAQIERFNVRTRQSEEFARLQVPRAFQNAALVGRRLYVFGGTSAAPGKGTGIMEDHARAGDRAWERMRGDRAAGRDRDSRVPSQGDRGNPGSAGNRSLSPPAGFPEPFLESVEYLDLDTREQGFAPDMPVAKAFFGTTVHDGKIYLIGGKKILGSRLANTNTVEIFDPQTRSWSEGIPMPTPRQNMAVTVDDFIIVAGGYDGWKKYEVVEFFSTKEGLWKALPPLAAPVSAAATVRLGKYLLLFGDYDSPGEVMIYDLSNRKSESFTFSYTPGRHAAAAVLGDRVYVVGGATTANGTALATIQEFALLADVRRATK